MTYNPDVAVVVVLFYPTQQVVDTICTNAGKLKVFIVDNTPGLSNVQLPVNAELLSSGNNGGTGFAYNLAAGAALQQNFSYLLLLDQDSEYPFQKLTEMREFCEQHPAAGIVSPYHLNPHSALPVNPGWKKLSSVMASGNLLRLKAWQSAGGFEEDFFLDYVDIEFCYRLLTGNFEIYCAEHIPMPHNEGNVSVVSFFGKQARTYNYPPFRWYYRTRNLLYLKKNYNTQFPELLELEREKYKRDVIKMLLYEKNRIRKVKAILKARKDAELGIKGISF